MRDKIVAGNWKMNTTASEASDLLHHLKTLTEERPPASTQVLVIPPFPYLMEAVRSSHEAAFQVGAQNCSEHASGAYTGEVSASMVASTGASHVLVGHSERRQYFEESNFVLAEKANQALANGLVPIYCCGETLQERQAKEHFAVIETQLVQALFHLSEADIRKVILAYEPVWAIGTGETASPEQAQEVHAFIRQLMEEQYGEEVASSISILYGGSCKPSNAQELFSQPDVDGGLIGGASLDADAFVQIIHSFS